MVNYIDLKVNLKPFKIDNSDRNIKIKIKLF